jgi:hypothetical protein
MKNLWFKLFPLKYEPIYVTCDYDYAGNEFLKVKVLFHETGRLRTFVGDYFTWNEYETGIRPPFVLKLKLLLISFEV